MASVFLDPVTLICILLAVLSWYTFRVGYRKITIATVSVLVVSVLLTSPMLANGLTYLLEGNSHYFSCNKGKAKAIVVLGGGVRGDVGRVDDTGKLHVSSFRRTQGALSLAQQESGLSIIISGGAGAKITESDLMAFLLQQQGISTSRIIKDDKSTSTSESGKYVAVLLKEMNIRAVYLVTSALHMTRAAKVFEKEGIGVCAYPVDRVLVIPKWYEMLNPQISSLTKTRNALHEIAGLFWYYLTGKI